MSDPTTNLLDRVKRHTGRLAVVDAAGEHGYDDLLAAGDRVAAALLAGRRSLEGARVAFLLPPGFAYVAVLMGVWRAGGIAVPLALPHPLPELDYVLGDCGAAIAVADAELGERLRPLAQKRRLAWHTSDELLGAAAVPTPSVPSTEGALLLYTSGSTGRPKGALLTHANLAAQVASLHAAWGWRPEDRLLNVLPLHHLHGVVNGLLSALAAGAVWETLPRFDAAAVWQRLEEGGITLLMAVPTHYRRLLSFWEAADPGRRAALSGAAARLRLMVSGSAPLPVPLFEGWRQATGHALLERYGMTEIGMALSNPLDGERLPGTVGRPLPRVEVRIVDEAGDPVADGSPGELEVRGATVFRGYWNRPAATRDAFRDGWFRTGDVAVCEAGVYRLLGRQSVDILKSGGEKVSALEVEAVLRGHPAVADCAVVGLPDPEWGERIVAAVVAAASVALDPEALRAWCRERLAAYKVPKEVVPVAELPANALGKVVKPELRQRLQGR